MFVVKTVDPEEEQRITKAYKLLEAEFREATEEEFRSIVIPYLWYKPSFEVEPRLVPPLAL